MRGVPARRTRKHIARWLDYRRLFDADNVNNVTENDYARDFRSDGLIYSQLVQIPNMHKTLIRTTASNFLQMLKWVDVNNRVKSFLTGTNMHFQISVADEQVLMLNRGYTTTDRMTHDSTSLTGSCSGGMNAVACRRAPLLYHNPSEPSAFPQQFLLIQDRFSPLHLAVYSCLPSSPHPEKVDCPCKRVCQRAQIHLLPCSLSNFYYSQRSVF